MGIYRKPVRVSIIKVCVLLLILSLMSFPALTERASAAPAPWPCTSGTNIGVNLPPDYEPSGIVWSPRHDGLFLVSDNGNLTQLDTDGNIASNWAVGGDLEGVAVVERRDSYVYLGIEQPDSIKEFSLSAGALTGRSWPLTAWMTGPDNQGLEALTFVPNGYHPYEPSTSGGLFYTGLQADGRIYVFNADLSTGGNVSHVATLTPEPGISDISGLYFCRETNILYAVYDSAGLMVEMNTDGTILNEYSLPGNDQEGVTVIPSGSGNGQAYIAEDVGPELWRYEPYPTECIDYQSSAYYLAEGSTAWGFSTWISVLNPNNEPVTAQVVYMTGHGPVVRGNTEIPADSAITIDPEADLGAEDFSTSVICLEHKQIAVERTMLWNGPDIHTSIGVQEPFNSWYFAEGSSEWGFETWLLIQNCCWEEAECEITYMTESGRSVPVSVVIPPCTRRTYNMADSIGAGDASIRVTSNREIICERTMYRNNRREGHCSVGAALPGTDYYLAEGSSAWGFTTYILVQNPNDSPVAVHTDYNTAGGPPPYNAEDYLLPPHSRKTIRVNDILGGYDFSTHVSGDGPLVAERAMYWDNGTGEACHASLGLIKPCNKFYIPFGKTSDGWETFVLVQNPDSEDISVTLSITGRSVLSEQIPANSRKTFNLSDITGPGEVGITVESDDRIMVEKAMYFNNRSGGSDTIGVPIE